MADLEAWTLERFGTERVRRIPYSPIQRTFYPNVVIPPEVKSLASQTVIEVLDAAEVSEILRAANERSAPVFVRQGAGPVSIDLDNALPPGALVVDLRRLAHIAVRPQSGYVELGAAVTLSASNKALGRLGYEFPIAVEPVSWGGLVSINLSGHLVDAASGKPGDYVLGLEVVLPTGQIIEPGTRSLRRLAGPDLTRIFVGGQGLYGVITMLRLRLVPAPGGRAWGLATFDDLGGLARAVQHAYTDRLPFAHLFELIEARFVRSSGLGAFVPDGELLLIATTGDRPEEAEWKLGVHLESARAVGAKEVRRLGDDAWRRIWDVREAPHHYLGGLEYLVGEVLDVPLADLPTAMATTTALRSKVEQSWPGLRGYLWGHIGSGTLHPAFACPSEWTYWRRVEVARDLRALIRDLRLSLGATVGEQGIVPEHLAWFARHYGSASVGLLGSMKSVFDPKGILNPGRLTVGPPR